MHSGCEWKLPGAQNGLPSISNQARGDGRRSDFMLAVALVEIEIKDKDKDKDKDRA